VIDTSEENAVARRPRQNHGPAFKAESPTRKELSDLCRLRPHLVARLNGAADDLDQDRSLGLCPARPPLFKRSD
jgi:hypothetical protein